MMSTSQFDAFGYEKRKAAQKIIVELVSRLIKASPGSEHKVLQFPLDGGMGLPGPYGMLDGSSGYGNLVPEGKSFWQIATGVRERGKVKAEYDRLVLKIPAGIRIVSTFVFVIPCNGEMGQSAPFLIECIAQRRKEHEWGAIKIIDGRKLTAWARQFEKINGWISKEKIKLFKPKA